MPDTSPRSITTMRLPRDMLTLLSQAAEARGLSRTKLVEQTLMDFLRAEGAVKSTPDPFA